MVLRYMPAGIVGFFLSAMMAASMSSMSGVWNTVSSIVSVDLYKNRFKPAATEKETLLVGRISVLPRPRRDPPGPGHHPQRLRGVLLQQYLLRSHRGSQRHPDASRDHDQEDLPLVCHGFRYGGGTHGVARPLRAEYSLGQQFLITVAVTLLFIVISNPLGRLYNVRRVYALVFSLRLSFAIYSLS